MDRIELNTCDVATLVDVLAKFPDIKHFTLERDGSSGIGYTIDMSFETKINDIECMVTVPVVGVENW
jgi:hypothetical protein